MAAMVEEKGKGMSEAKKEKGVIQQGTESPAAVLFSSQPSSNCVRKHVRVLAVDATFDDTSVALVEMETQGADGAVEARTLGETSESSWSEHADLADVDKELAALRHRERLPAACERVLAQAGSDLAEVDAVAFSHAPGSMACLMASFEFVRALAARAVRPLVPVNHLEAHFLVAGLETGGPDLPALVL